MGSVIPVKYDYCLGDRKLGFTSDLVAKVGLG